MNIIDVTQRTVGQETVQTVNARELHGFLEVGKDFSSWIKDRIAKYEFADGHDFVSIDVLSSPKLGSAKARPQKIIEYHLTLDMAKELAMVENSNKGREARRYFIACEKRLNALPSKPDNFEVLGGINVKKLEQATKLHRSVRMLARSRGLGLPEQVAQADQVILQNTGFDIPKLLGLPSSYVAQKHKTTNQTLLERIALLEEEKKDDRAHSNEREELLNILQIKINWLENKPSVEHPPKPKIITAINKRGVLLETSESEMLNASTLAEYTGFSSAIAINKWLVEHNLQEPVVDRSGHQSYKPVGQGAEFGVVNMVQRHNAHGSAVPQLCWKAGFVEVVRKLLECQQDDSRVSNDMFAKQHHAAPEQPRNQTRKSLCRKIF